MPIPASMQRDLRALSDALDDPDADLSGSIAQLAASVRLTSASYLGLSLLVASSPEDLVLPVFDEASDRSMARTSLFMSLSPSDGSSDEPTLTGIVLYAATPGAFVDLAADARWLDLADSLSLDQHLPAPADATPTVLLDRSAINQALGVLLARGITLEQAKVDLAGRADGGRMSRVDAARGILAEVEGSSFR